MTLNIQAVQAFMSDNGWGEKELAERVGVTYTQVYRVLRGQRAPGNEFIAGITKAFKESRPDGDPIEALFIFTDDLPKGK